MCITTLIVYFVSCFVKQLSKFPYSVYHFMGISNSDGSSFTHLINSEMTIHDYVR